MDYSVLREKGKMFEDARIVRILFSHRYIAFFYGIFLFLYELKFIRNYVSIFHPVLIIWSALIIFYDIFIRKNWNQIPYWKNLILFTFSTGITAILTLEAGIVGNIKSCVLTSVPLFIFYPICFFGYKGNRLKIFLVTMSGAAAVSCFASGIALWMYLTRFSETITMGGITSPVGIIHYMPNDPSSAVLLYGIYTDTNHAAIYALAFIIYGIILLHYSSRKTIENIYVKRGLQIFAVLNIIIQVFYFPLANSRGGLLSICVSLFVVSFLYCFCKFEKRQNKFILCILSVVIAIGLVLFSSAIFWMARTGMTAISTYMEANNVEVRKIGKNESKTDEAERMQGGITENLNVENEEKGEKIVEDVNNDKVDEKAKDIKSTTNVEQTTDVKKDSFTKKNEHLGAGRLDIWEDTITLIKHRVLMGEGPGNTTYYAAVYSPEGVIAQKGSAVHNSYLDLILDYGIVGAVLLLSFWLLCANKILKDLLKEKKQFDICFYLCILIVLVTASGAFFISSAFINVTALYFIMLIGTSYVVSECTLQG